MHTTTLPAYPSTDHRATDGDDLRRRLVRDADTCVACGMCLPVCPTYMETRSEAESARGRIALIRGVAEGRLEPGEELLRHLDRCLHCQACEAVCPAAVPYGRLMDGARTLLRRIAPPPRSGLGDHIAWFLRTPLRLRLLSMALVAYRASGVRWLARRSGLLRRAGLAGGDALVEAPALRTGWKPFYPAMGSERGRVALFVGCVARIADRENLAAAVNVLRKLGYGVHVPAGQGCCGAVDLHAGREDRYREALARNGAAFQDLDVEAVVSIASGCTAVLQRPVAVIDGAALPPVVDISDFLLRAEWPVQVRVRPAELEVYVHTPCTLKNAVRRPQAPLRLLERIPGLRVQAASGDAPCCGAAGTYSLRHPDTARQLALRTLAPAVEAKVATIATSNVGCAMHLQAVAREEGGAVRITHPVKLLDDCLYIDDGAADGSDH